MNARIRSRRRLEPGLGPAGQQGVLDLGVRLGQPGLRGKVSHLGPSLLVTVLDAGPGWPCRPPGGSRAPRRSGWSGVGLVGEQAGRAHPAGDDALRDLRDRGAGVPAAAPLARRVDRADPGHPERRGVGAGQVHRPPPSSQNQTRPPRDPDAACRRSPKVLVAVPVAGPPAGLLVGVAVEGAEPVAARSPSSSSVAGRSAPGGGRRSTSSPSSNSRVCIATRTLPPVSRAVSSAKMRVAGSAPLTPPAGLAPVVQLPGPAAGPPRPASAGGTADAARTARSASPPRPPRPRRGRRRTSSAGPSVGAVRALGHGALGHGGDDGAHDGLARPGGPRPPRGTQPGRRRTQLHARTLVTPLPCHPFPTLRRVSLLAGRRVSSCDRVARPAPRRAITPRAGDRGVTCGSVAFAP